MSTKCVTYHFSTFGFPLLLNRKGIIFFFPCPPFFLSPLLIVTKRRFQPCLFGIYTHLVQNSRKGSEINGTDAFQICNPSELPILVLLFWKHTYIHQYNHRRCITSFMALMVHRRMYFPI